MTQQEKDDLEQRIRGYAGRSFEERLALYLPAYKQRIAKAPLEERYRMRIKYEELKNLLETLKYR